jgi:hypothetical protein
MATSNHIIFGAYSTLTDRDYMIHSIGFLSAVVADVVIAQ